MKYRIATIAVASMFALASCDDAASRIQNAENSTPSTNYNANGMNTQNNGVSANDVAAEGSAQFEFDKMEHDFGDVDEGNTVNTVFKFTNTGDAPLIISNAAGSCGCTVPEYPRTPIAPGEQGEMKVSFSSANKSGDQNKTVTITANTVPQTTVLKIHANVIR